jgi:hypothetical protein
LSKYWKIPPDGDAAFVAAMEDVLDVYRLPYDPRFPVVCMDESSKQLIGEVHAPIPTKPGQVAIADHEYVRQGVAMLFVEVEPLTGRRHVEVTERRTRQDWAHFIKGMLEQRYPEAIKVRLVMDNLNTHAIASLYSWLNIAEIELSALNGQCLRRRIPDIESMRCQTSAWQNHRNNRGAPINWRFTTEDARIKLLRLYPKL